VEDPIVSIVTPFHNTSAYLGQCIESVLAQTFREFEYILVDNCSTDGSGKIAESYARLDSRIRVIKRDSLLSQVQNYNSALTEVSPSCQYVKIVQADDFIFPACIELMVGIFETSNSIGLVSSYWLKGSELRGSGFPHSTEVLPGKEVVRRYLRTGLWVFGSPTAVMYKSSLIEKGKPFYNESHLHEDTEKCMELLEHLDFGFAHQVLSFSRSDNESISSAVRPLCPENLDRYIVVQRYAGRFLPSDESVALKRSSRRDYYRVLARGVFRLRKSDFWNYHRRGLETIGESISIGYLLQQMIVEALWLAVNPGRAINSALRRLRVVAKKGL
jgi:glycosyltransferase involved in cell wall biosynthesis